MMDDEKYYALTATALLAKRNADGSVFKDEQGMGHLLDPMDALKLLGKIDSYSTGMGAFNLLVPVAAVRAAGLEDVWNKANFTTFPHKNAQHYDVGDYMLGVAIIERLELQAGEKWDAARARYEAATARTSSTVER
jgi:hypothetical protein